MSGPLENDRAYHQGSARDGLAIIVSKQVETETGPTREKGASFNHRRGTQDAGREIQRAGNPAVTKQKKLKTNARAGGIVGVRFWGESRVSKSHGCVLILDTLRLRRQTCSIDFNLLSIWLLRTRFGEGTKRLKIERGFFSYQGSSESGTSETDWQIVCSDVVIYGRLTGLTLPVRCAEYRPHF